MELNVFRNGWAAVVLVVTGIPLAVVGIIVAQSLGDYIAAMAVSIFAGILIFSLVCNGAIVLVSRLRRPLLLVHPFGLPLVQGLLLVLECTWIVALIRHDALVGIATSVTIASVSIAVFALAVASDAPANPARLERSQQRAAARDARPPAERRRRRIRAAVITGVLLAAVAVPVTLVQTTTTVHRGCDVAGSFYSGGTIIVSTTNCGDFFQFGTASDYRRTEGQFGTFDIVTRGYWLGIPSRPLLVELRPAGA